MARAPRIHFVGAFYPFMLREINENNIFFENEDRYTF
jgi:hypothetical protein